MPSTETIILVALAGFALSASPGPSMLYVLSRSIGQDRFAGLMSAAGLATGGVLHAVAAAAGLSAVFTYWPRAYQVVTIVGAGYLVYLGVQMYRTRHEEMGSPERVRHAAPWRIFGQGVLVETLNPKTALFFIAFLPQFVDQGAQAIATQVLILGMLIPLTAVPSDLVVAFAGGALARKIGTHRGVACSLNCLGALFLIALGLRILLGLG